MSGSGFHWVRYYYRDWIVETRRLRPYPNLALRLLAEESMIDPRHSVRDDDAGNARLCNISHQEFQQAKAELIRQELIYIKNGRIFVPLALNAIKEAEIAAKKEEKRREKISKSRTAERINGNGVVYLLPFPDGKGYVGQTMSFKSRMFSYSSMNRQKQPSLYDAIKKHGWHSISPIILAHGIPNQRALDIIERVAISRYKTLMPNGYNSMYGGKMRRQRHG